MGVKEWLSEKSGTIILSLFAVGMILVLGLFLVVMIHTGIFGTEENLIASNALVSYSSSKNLTFVIASSIDSGNVIINVTLSELIALANQYNCTIYSTMFSANTILMMPPPSASLHIFVKYGSPELVEYRCFLYYHIDNYNAFSPNYGFWTENKYF